MRIESESNSFSASQDGGTLPAEGMVIFTAPFHAGAVDLTHVQVVINDEDIEQTGIAQQGADSFSLQITLKPGGSRLFHKWTSQPGATPLYLAVDGMTIHPKALSAVDADTIELAGLSFNRVYALAATLEYDQDALSELSRLDPQQNRFQPSESEPATTLWRIASDSGQFLGDQMEDILTILNNRFEAFFNVLVSAQRAQSAMEVAAPDLIDQNELVKIVSTPGQAVIFSSRQRPRAGEALPADAQPILTQDDIQITALENTDHVTLVIDLDDSGIEALARYQKLAFQPPLYLALDGSVAAAQNFILSGDSRLEMDDLPEKEALFLWAILDNDPLPGRLTLSPVGAALQDEEMPMTWKVAPNDPGFEGLDEIFIILNNRARMLYQYEVSVERAQSSLRIISTPQIDGNQLLRMTTTLGKASLFTSSQASKLGAPIPPGALQLLNESHIISVALEDPGRSTLVLELDEEGSRQLAAAQQQFPGLSLNLALDGRVVAETALLFTSASELKLTGLQPEEALFLRAILDNDVLPTSLSISPITISRADESFLRGFNDLWLVKPVEDVALDMQDWEAIRSILTYRIETLFKDATSIEFEGGRLTIIPDLHTDPEDLKALVTHRGQALVFSAPFAPGENETLPQSARPVLTSDEISSVSVDEGEIDSTLIIKLNVEGARLKQDDIKFHPNHHLYLAIDGEVASSLSLNTDGGSTLFLEGISVHQAVYLAALLDNDALPLELTLEPLELDQYDQFVPESNQVWYVESADETGDLTRDRLDQSLKILNERAADLLDGLVTFEADDSWGLLVQFPGQDTPINLDILEQIVGRQGRIGIFTTATPPTPGEMVGLLSSHTYFNEEQIQSAEVDGLIAPAVLKLSLSRSGRNELSSLHGKALYLAVDDEIISDQPFLVDADGTLRLAGLDFEIARFLAVLINHGRLPMLLRINMEEESD